MSMYSWNIILEKYMLCDSEETQKVCTNTHTKDRP